MDFIAARRTPDGMEQDGEHVPSPTCHVLAFGLKLLRGLQDAPYALRHRDGNLEPRLPHPVRQAHEDPVLQRLRPRVDQTAAVSIIKSAVPSSAENSRVWTPYNHNDCPPLR